MTDDQTPTPRSHIVVGVDGSEPSKHGLRWAKFLARASASTLVVVAAWEPSLWSSLSTIRCESRSSSRTLRSGFERCND